MFTIWMRLVYLSFPTKQDKEQGKVFGHKIQKDRLTLALVVNTTCTYLQISMPKMLWKVIANKLCVVIRKPNGPWRTSCVFEIWMMSLDVHLKPQKQKVLLIMDNPTIHSLRHVGSCKSF